ncbi:MAG: xanthine dehydrogenase family protein subunit M [Desulfomonile tiedjei]|uniref:Xanthine dehydrogenase family protein subunit M n=1 Tax=Desulfomonile tiedjei TaxID=2358 RepID=A0A9D6V631_9BACT|nr:xanthine dehydrogenase family protein subunit M [Desulfomonile tiedjei]
MRQVSLPRTLGELWAVLQRQPHSAVYAGGTDLFVKIRDGQLNPESLVCLERLTELQGVQDNGDELFIGAATTHSKLIVAESVREHLRVLVKAASVLGSPPIRHMGTIGGNIVTASPAGDTLPALYVLSAEVEIRHCEGSKRIPINEFIIGPGTVDLAKGEILAGVWLRKHQGWNLSHYEKIGRRKAQACAIASMAAVLELTETGKVKRARLAWGSVGPTVITSEGVENALIGEQLSLEVLKNAGTMLDKAISPIYDIRAGADYRRMVSKAMLLRLNDYACGTTY